MATRKMLNILSGQQTANIKSFPIAAGQELMQGDWVVFENDKLVKQAGVYTGAKAVFPVYAGNVTFYDTKYLNEADVVTAKSCILETDNMDGVTFHAGDAVYVMDGKLTDLATAGATAKVVGYAIEPSGVNIAGKNIVKFQMA